MSQIYITKTAEETFALGASLGKQLIAGDTVALYGGLGAGKTVFTKGIASGLGISDEITSPTFTLLRQYTGRLPLCHFDLYRIEDEQELHEIGFYDYLDSDSVCVIEWPQNASDLRETIRVNISGNGAEQRHIEIIRSGENGC